MHSHGADTLAKATLPLMKRFKPCGIALKTATERKSERDERDEVNVNMKMVLLYELLAAYPLHGD